MNKKFINGLLAVSLLTGSAVSFTSCSDYDDDISDLRTQISGITSKVSEVESMIQSGKTITNVSQTADGIAITIDGTTYTITNGKDGAAGKDGANGADGTAWTIGTDGFWYQNGQKTSYKAIGADGAAGKDGVNGTNGTNGTNGVDGKDGKDGANGEYYVPEANGFFAIYKDGEKIKDTTISWKSETTVSGSGITAIYTGTKLILSGVDGSDTDVEINIGVAVGSIAFVPSVLSNETKYPTTDKPFMHIDNYLDEAKYDKTTFEFEPQAGFEKSNNVELVYRVNPSDAFIADNADYSFINRVVTSRAADDKVNLLKVVGSPVYEGGEITLSASINYSALLKENPDKKGEFERIGGNHIAALNVWNGQANTISDYIEVDIIEDVTLSLVDSVATVKDKAKNDESIKERKYAITKDNEETDKFIKETVGMGLDIDTYAAYLAYNSEVGLNLKDIPGLYVDAEKDFLANLGFTGISYKFSLPKEYLADDALKTNQQDFVVLDGTFLKINTAILTGTLTQAIGRTPVVRIDAFLTNNEGEAKLVASGYIKILITEFVAETEDKAPITVNISKDAEREYHGLITLPDSIVGKMSWLEVNNLIYGQTGLTSTNFWDYYGTDESKYTVTISTIKDSEELILLEEDEKELDKRWGYAGIVGYVNINSENTQTSEIKIGVTDKIKTQNTYDDVDGKGAKYTVTITIPSKNPKVLGDIVMTQVIYVKETCVQYPFYGWTYTATDGDYKDVVSVKGKVVGDKYVYSANISEAFQVLNGETVFDYYNKYYRDDKNNGKIVVDNNVDNVEFSINAKDDEELGALEEMIEYDESTHEIKLTTALTKDLFVPMKYVETLSNGETCTFTFYVKFVNPFKAASPSAITINGNSSVEQNVPIITGPNTPYVLDINNNLIVVAKNGTPGLTIVAKGDAYSLTDEDLEVSFAFDEENADYKFVMEGLDTKAGSKLEVDEETGVVTFVNQGLVINSDKTVIVLMTVKLDTISEVVVKIPVTIKK